MTGHNAVETGAIELAHAEAAGTEAAVDHAPADHDPRLGRRMLRSPTAWAITGIFTVSTVLAYSAFAWFPTLLVERAGVTPAEAGTLLALFAITGFPCSLIVPVIAARVRSVAPIVLVATAFGGVGLLGLLFAPASGAVAVGDARGPRHADLPALARADQPAHAHRRPARSC